MFAAKMPPRRLSPEEYLAQEEQATERHEYLNLLIHQNQPLVEYHHKTSGGWLLTEIAGMDATLCVQELAFEMPFRELYADVDWLTA